LARIHLTYVRGAAAGRDLKPLAGGLSGTVELLRQSLQPGGVMLVGEPYWRQEPADQATVEGCHAASKDDFLPLPELTGRFGELGCDVVEIVLACPDSWDRYVAAQTRRALGP
jgi:hypothetical protein